MSKDILEQAIADAKQLREAAIENAKNVLVEALSPKIKEMVDTQLGEAEDASDDQYKEPDEDLPMEMYEAADEDEMTEAKDEDDDEEEESDMDESVLQITQEDVRNAVKEFLQQEATVTKSFADVQDPTPKVAGGKGETGILDTKNGESQWSEETPPDSEDWTVKESAYREALTQLKKENAKLRNVNKQVYEAFNQLKSNLQEVNVFNSKLLYTNKLLQNAQLSNKQKISVIEAFDKAKSLREVELVFESLSKSFEIAGVLGESKRATSMKTSRSSRSTVSSGPSKILEEQRNQESGENSQLNRWKILAGLVE